MNNMQEAIINDEQAKLIADFANAQTRRLVTFCKKNKNKFGEKPNAVLMTAYAVNIVAILKSIEHSVSHKLMAAELKDMILALLDKSIQWSLRK